MSECQHEKSVTTDMSKHGVLAQVTVCADCGHPLDYRPLRHVDVTGACDLPEEESMIQARAKIAKAKETGLADEIKEESGIVEALPDVPPEALAMPEEKEGMGDWIDHPSFAPRAMPCPSCGVVANPDGVCEETGCKMKGQEVIPEPAPAPPPVERHRSRADSSPVMCEKHGGNIEPCDTGTRRAHNCHHSRWGVLRTFDGPCACSECHKDPPGVTTKR